MELQNRVEILANIPFFYHFDENERQMIAECAEYVQLQKNQHIFEEGDLADFFYIIITGTVQVTKQIENEQVEVLALKISGDIFGEMGIIDNLPRSATVVAATDVELFKISNTQIHDMMKEIPSISLEISKAICMNVRSSNFNYINELEDQNRKLQEANQQLKDAQDKLIKAERLSAIGKFTSFIIHDIKNPLANMRSYAELIIMNEQTTGSINKSAKIITQEADRLAEMTKDLLDFSKGAITLDTAKITLSYIINQMMPVLDIDFKNHSMSITTELHDSSLILLDVDRIKRVIENIAHNAIGAMQTNGEFLIRTEEDDTVVKMILSDNGIGMTQEIMDNMYEPFFSKGKKSGTGLGLAISKSILNAHGAKIEVSSEVDNGTSFYITFPK